MLKIFGWEKNTYFRNIMSIAIKRNKIINKLNLSIAILIGLFLPSPAISDDSATIAAGHCYEMSNNINGLVDFTETKCIPSQDNKGVSFIFISSKPILSVDKAKKPWLLTVVGAVGYTLNQHPKYKTDKIIFTDTNIVRERKGYFLSSKIVKDLQKNIKADKINIETMYKSIINNLRPYTVNK